jgi:hypothetical protein
MALKTSRAALLLLSIFGSGCYDSSLEPAYLIKHAIDDHTIDLRAVADGADLICLSSNREGTIDAMDLNQLPRGNRFRFERLVQTDESTVLILIYKNSDPVRQILASTTGLRNSTLIKTNYAARPIAGHRQCSEASRAIAHCVPLGGARAGACILLFKSTNE